MKAKWVRSASAWMVSGSRSISNPQGLQDVCSTTQRGRGAVAVFDDGHAGRGDDEGRHRGDDGVVPVPAGTDNVDGLGDVTEVHRCRELAHGVRWTRARRR